MKGQLTSGIGRELLGHLCPDWAADLTLSLPSDAAEATRAGLDADWTSIAQRLRTMAAFTNRMPGSSRLPMSYRAVPGFARTIVAKAIGHSQRRRSAHWAAFPRWPLDLSADVADALGGKVWRHQSGRTPVVLSHDLDSPEGLINSLALFAPIEEEVGARAVNFVVPAAWPLDHARLEALRSRGHEIGVHGYDHSNKTPFCAPHQRRQRLAAARPLIERYGVQGYRAPSLLRTEPLLQDLASLYQYDSSIPTSGGLFPVPNNGCASARPFRIAGIVELPISLPRDGSLLFLGYRAEEILETWRQAADRVARAGGVVTLLTHCEARFSGSRPMLEVYRRFLHALAADDRFMFLLPAELARGVEALAA